MTTSRASRASTGGSVLPGGAAGQVLTKRSGTNDDLAWGDINTTTYNNPTATGLVTAQAAGGNAEAVVLGMSVSNLQPGVVASVNLLLWVSMNDFGTVKGVTMRLRDGSVTGTILQSVVRSISTDTSTGHDQNFVFTGNVTPATNTLVVTVQRTSASTVAVLSDTRTFTVTQSGGGFTPVGGTTGQVLTKTTNADLNYGWATPAVGGGGGSGTGAVPTAKVIKTAGNYTLNNIAWTTVDSSLDLTLAASVGDVIAVGLSAYAVPQSNVQYVAMDAVTVVAGTAVNSLASGTSTPPTSGFPAWNIIGPNIECGLGGTMLYTVVAGDLSGGNVVIRLRYKTANAVASILRATTADPLHFWAENLSKVSGVSGTGVTTGTDTTLAATPQVLAVAAKSQVFGTTTLSPLVDTLLVIHATATISNSPTGNQGAYFGPLVASPQTGGTVPGGRFSAGPAPVSPGVTTMNQTIQNPLSGSTFGDSLFYLRAGVTYTIGYDLQAGSGAGSVTFSNIQSTYSTTPFGGGGSSGSWTTYTPADIAAVTTNPSLGTGATKTGQYLNDGTNVKADVYYKVGTSPSAGSGAYKFAFPVPLVGFFPGQVVGHGWMYTAGVGVVTQQVLAIDANFYHLFATATAAWEFTSGNNAGWWAVGNEMAHRLDYRIR